MLVAWWLACVGMLCACGGEAGAIDASHGASRPGTQVQAGQGGGAIGQDRFPERADPAIVHDPVPFASAGRERVAIVDTITRHGEPLEIGSIEVPEGWSAIEMDGFARSACSTALHCVLWQAVSPDGTARLMLLSPRRGFEAPARGEGSAPARIALAWLHPPDDAMPARGDVELTSAVLPAMAVATRKGWTAGGAWLSMAYEAFGTPMRELRALDVEARPDNGRFHRVQGWPMLVLRMPADGYDATAADAMRRSLRVDPEWVAQWWLAWEIRTIREQCKRGYVRGMCHVDAGYADYFRAGDGMGLWDIRSESRYELPAGQRYDASAGRQR